MVLFVLILIFSYILYLYLLSILQLVFKIMDMYRQPKLSSTPKCKYTIFFLSLTKLQQKIKVIFANSLSTILFHLILHDFSEELHLYPKLLFILGRNCVSNTT